MEIRSYVALGERFTEGSTIDAVGGGYRAGGPLRGALASAHPSLCYANLAVRGRLWARSWTSRSAGHRVPADLVSLAGRNDMLRPGSDPDAC